MRYPILYTANATDFSTMGIGMLSDATKCSCTQDNGSYELELEYPVNGVNYSSIAHSCYIKAVVPPLYERSPQLFRIYSISKPLNGLVTINAEHVFKQLSYIPVKPFTALLVSQFFERLRSNAVEDCPFTFSTNMPNERIDFRSYIPASALEMLGTEEGRLQDLIYGEFLWDNYNVTFNNTVGNDNGVEFRYGVNITDITQEENILETVTGVCPYWHGYTDGGEDIVKMMDEYVVHVPAADNYPFKRTIPLDVSSAFEEEPTSAEIKAYAESYMAKNQIGYPEINIDIEVADIAGSPEYAQFENLFKADLYDTVTVIFPKLGIKKKAKIVQTKYDVLNERYESMSIGDIQQSLGSTITSVVEKNTAKKVQTLSDEMKQSLVEQAALLTGGLGGHVVINKSNEGYPNEILIMDTEDKATAVNVLRINMNGIAFSTNGYNGPFNTAWTIDGRFIADYIASGTINAIDIIGSLIKGATIVFGTDNTKTVTASGDSSGVNFEGTGRTRFRTVGTFNANNYSDTSYSTQYNHLSMGKYTNSSQQDYTSAELYNYDLDGNSTNYIDMQYLNNVSNMWLVNRVRNATRNSISISAGTSSGVIQIQNKDFIDPTKNANTLYLQAFDQPNSIVMSNNDHSGVLVNQFGMSYYPAGYITPTSTESSSVNIINKVNGVTRNSLSMTSYPSDSASNVFINSYGTDGSTGSRIALYTNSMNLMLTGTTAPRIFLDRSSNTISFRTGGTDHQATWVTFPDKNGTNHCVLAFY